MNRVKKNWYVAGAAAMVILVAPLVTNRESIDVLDARRNTAGDYFDDRGNKTQYQLEGEGETVVLLHGSSGPMTTWDKNYDFLVNNGFRVLRYNYYGRGLSDRPEVDYDLDQYVNQLEHLLAGLRLSGPFHLVGHSFGCVLASEFAQRHKESTKSVTLIAPAGFKLESNPAARLLKVPILGDYMMRLIGDGMLLSHNKKYFLDHKKHKKLVKAYIAQSKIKGFKRVQKSTFLHAPLQSYEEGYGGLGETGLPVKIVWARDDITFPFEHSETALGQMPQATLVPIDQARHVPQYEQPDAVNAALLQWLTSGT